MEDLGLPCSPELHIQFYMENFGLLRSREFVMKDLYSFHADQKDARRCYDDVMQCYHALFRRLGCPYVVVEADSGNIGFAGSLTHEFHILSDVGQLRILRRKFNF